MGFNWSIISAAAKIIQLETKFAEEIDELGTLEALKFAAGFDAKFFELSLALLADAPDFAHRQFAHELRNVFWLQFKLTIRLVCFAGDFGQQFIGSNSSGRCQPGVVKNCTADRLCQGSRRARMRADIQIRF